MGSLKKGFYVGLTIFPLVGMLAAQTQNEKTTIIISRVPAIVSRAGLIYKAEFLQTYPKMSYPVLLDANQTNITYPYAFSWEVYNDYYNFAINEVHNASNASIIFVPLGIKAPDDLDDWAISIAISKAHTYAESKYDIVFSFVGTEAYLEALVATINALEDLGIEYSIYGFSHGVLNNETHGVIMYDASMTPIVVNGEILGQSPKSTFAINSATKHGLWIVGAIISVAAETRIRTGEIEEIIENSAHEASKQMEESDDGIIDERKFGEKVKKELKDIFGSSTGDKIRLVVDIAFAFTAIAALKGFTIFEDEKTSILTMATINILATLADMHQDNEISVTDLLENILIGINLRQLATITNTLPI